MVVGFDKFREAFREFADNYIVIGGSACDWLMQSENAIFRATKDIDLVIIAENMTGGFAARLWKFIRDGGYEAYERRDGKKCFYRFMRPKTVESPFMLELFSRRPLAFDIAENSVITPIPIGEDDISSLSGILLDEDYYSFIKSHRKVVEGVSVLSAEALVLLKAKAWMDLLMRKEGGAFVKDKDLRKHRTDVLRLQAHIPEGTVVPLSQHLRDDFALFLDRYEKLPLDARTIGVPNSFEDAISLMRSTFLGSSASEYDIIPRHEEKQI